MSPNFRVNPARLVADIVDTLSPRLKEVVSLRFGLKDGRRHTLEAIGQKYGITRERVRQIQNDAFKQLARAPLMQKVKPLFEALNDHVEAHGGVRKESALLEADLASYGNDLHKPEQKSAVYFAMHLHPEFERHLEDDGWHTFWTSTKSGSATVKRFANSLVDHFESRTLPLGEKEMKELVERMLSKLGYKGSLNARVANAYCGLIKPVSRNIYGEYGLRKWPEINPVGVRDKAYLVFKKLQKPMHFKDVALAINQAGFSKRSAHPQTVHNELIKDERFVLIGRGIYALKEWGYAAGTVKDVLVGILKKSGRPLSKEEIMDSIAKQRIVKPNTIVLNLQNKSYFKKTSDGRFALA